MRQPFFKDFLTMKTLAVFDLDGTLIDSLADLANAINHTRAAAGLSQLTLDEANSCVGNGVDNLIDKAIPAEAMEHDTAKGIFKEFYSKHSTDFTKLYPGTKESIECLKAAGVICCVVTNKPFAACKVLLDTFGISSIFDEIIGGGSGFTLKPEPEALLYLKEKYNAENCFMCGDHYTDLECARRAGFTSILAAYGFGDPRSEVPVFKAETITHAADMILKNRVE